MANYACNNTICQIVGVHTVECIEAHRTDLVRWREGERDKYPPKPAEPPRTPEPTECPNCANPPHEGGCKRSMGPKRTWGFSSHAHVSSADPNRCQYCGWSRDSAHHLPEPTGAQVDIEPEFTRAERNASGDEATKAARKNRAAPEVKCKSFHGAQVEFRDGKVVCPDCDTPLVWVKASQLQSAMRPDPRLAELSEMLGAAERTRDNYRTALDRGVSQRLVLEERLERQEARLAELLAAGNILKAAWADMVRCNGSLASVIEKTLAAVAAFEEGK